MKNNEALINTVVMVITIIATSFIGAMVGAFIGAIKGPAHILLQFNSDGNGAEEKQETSTDAKDRI